MDYGSVDCIALFRKIQLFLQKQINQSKHSHLNEDSIYKLNILQNFAKENNKNPKVLKSTGNTHTRIVLRSTNVLKTMNSIEIF